MLSFWYIIRADDTGEGGVGEGMAPNFFAKQKEERETKDKKERVSK